MRVDEIPPEVIEAEQIVLGSCMQSPAAIEYLRPKDMVRPAHQMIGHAIAHLAATDSDTGAVSVSVELGKRGEITKCGGAPYLHTCIAAVASPAMVAPFAATVSDEASRRRLVALADHAAQRARDRTEPVEATADHIAERLNALRWSEADDIDTLRTLGEFVDQPEPDIEFVLPGILARGDRLVLTGTEGAGKTTLLRQFAMSAAAGVHPFTLVPCKPRIVLALDMENPLGMMIGWWRHMSEAATRRGRPVEDGRLMIDRRPGGIDLASTDDRRWLTRRVELVRPDLLVIGPAYKLYVGGDNQREETLARQVTSVLDGLRESVGCAIVVEHHSPHAAQGTRVRSVRPIGSSLWLRWPEFGFGIRPAEDTLRRTVDVVSWRGPREERPWPTRMEAGPQGWPWVEAEPLAARAWSA